MEAKQNSTLEGLRAAIEEIRAEARAARRLSLESDTIGELAKALAKAQGEMKLAPELKMAHHGKYADLGSVIKTSRSPLSKAGLAVIQRIVVDGTGGHLLFTRLCHESGEWIESRMKLTPAKTDIQSMGSYITYVRRYCMCSIIGMAGGDDDDDGLGTLTDEEVLHKQKEAGIIKRITKGQAAQLSEIVREFPEEMRTEMMARLEKKYGVDRLSDLPDWSFKEVLDGLTKLKQTIGIP